MAAAAVAAAEWAAVTAASVAAEGGEVEMAVAAGVVKVADVGAEVMSS